MRTLVSRRIGSLRTRIEINELLTSGSCYRVGIESIEMTVVVFPAESVFAQLCFALSIMYENLSSIACSLRSAGARVCRFSPMRNSS